MKTVISVLFLGLSIMVFGQKKEYLVKQNGDTIYGEINVKNKEFVFTDKDSVITYYKAEEIKSVQLKKHQGSLVLLCKLNTYTDNLEYLEKNTFFSQELDTVLILTEVYNTPKMNLYWCKDDNQSQYYFYKRPEDPVPVQLYVNYTLGGGTSQTAMIQLHGRGSTQLVVQKGYVNQLDSSWATVRISQMKYGNRLITESTA